MSDEAPQEPRHEPRPQPQTHFSVNDLADPRKRMEFLYQYIMEDLGENAALLRQALVKLDDINSDLSSLPDQVRRALDEGVRAAQSERERAARSKVIIGGVCLLIGLALGCVMAVFFF